MYIFVNVKIIFTIQINTEIAAKSLDGLSNNFILTTYLCYDGQPIVEQIRWYHNNQEAESERYQYIHEGGFYCLDIVPVTLEDGGLWVCTAQNYAGKSSTAAHLSLTGEKVCNFGFFFHLHSTDVV